VNPTRQYLRQQVASGISQIAANQARRSKFSRKAYCSFVPPNRAGTLREGDKPVKAGRQGGPSDSCRLNPAVSVGLAVGGRFPIGDLGPCIVAQVLGATAAASVLYLIASGKAGFELSAGFAANGYGAHSPGGYSLTAGLLCELVLTAGFLFVIMGATDKRAPAGFAPIAIGLALTLIHLISIPVTNTSVNPARSTSQALFVGGWALRQLWLFWVAPIIGGAAGAIAYRWLSSERQPMTTAPGATLRPAE
jgi:aquaporin Z